MSESLEANLLGSESSHLCETAAVRSAKCLALPFSLERGSFSSPPGTPMLGTLAIFVGLVSRVAYWRLAILTGQGKEGCALSTRGLLQLASGDPNAWYPGHLCWSGVSCCLLAPCYSDKARQRMVRFIDQGSNIRPQRVI